MQRSNSDCKPRFCLKFAQLRGVAHKLIPLDVVLPRLFFWFEKAGSDLGTAGHVRAKQCSLRAFSTPFRTIGSVLSFSSWQDGSSYFTPRWCCFLAPNGHPRWAEYNNDIKEDIVKERKATTAAGKFTQPFRVHSQAKVQLDRKDETRFAHLLALSAAAFGRSGPAMVTSILITTRLTKSWSLVKNGSHLVQMTRLRRPGPPNSNVYARCGGRCYGMCVF